MEKRVWASRSMSFGKEIDVGDPSLPNTDFSLTPFVTVGGTQGETPHYCSSAGIAILSLLREGLVLGNREAKRGKEHYRHF